MKPVLPTLFAMLAATLSGLAAPYQLEIRILRVSGDDPADEVLTQLVEHTEAQVAKLVSKVEKPGTTKIKEVTPFRYGTEFDQDGKPVDFATRDLGFEGNVALSEMDSPGITLRSNLAWVRPMAPVVYNIKGSKSQVLQSVFQRELGPTECRLPLGKWVFSKCPKAPSPALAEQIVWALRLTRPDQE